MPANPDDDIPPFLARTPEDLGPLLGKAEPAPEIPPTIPPEIPPVITKPVATVPAVRQTSVAKETYPPRWKRRPDYPAHVGTATYPPQWKRM